MMLSCSLMVNDNTKNLRSNPPANRSGNYLKNKREKVTSKSQGAFAILINKK